jgi:hypothetical protein
VNGVVASGQQALPEFLKFQGEIRPARCSGAKVVGVQCEVCKSIPL